MWYKTNKQTKHLNSNIESILCVNLNTLLQTANDLWQCVGCILNHELFSAYYISILKTQTKHRLFLFSNLYFWCKSYVTEEIDTICLSVQHSRMHVFYIDNISDTNCV